jgi:hypothetical protein
MAVRVQIWDSSCAIQLRVERIRAIRRSRADDRVRQRAGLRVAEEVGAEEAERPVARDREDLGRRLDEARRQERNELLVAFRPAATWSAATHGPMVGSRLDRRDATGRSSWRRRASVTSSSMVIVDLRLVRPVTTASGKLAAARGGVGMAVGSSDGVGVAEGTRLGLGVAHPTSMVKTATAVTPRSVAGGFTALS